MTFAALTFIFFPLVVICERKENFNKAQSNQQNKTKRFLKALYATPKITLSRLFILYIQTEKKCLIYMLIHINIQLTSEDFYYISIQLLFNTFFVRYSLKGQFFCCGVYSTDGNISDKYILKIGAKTI